jgi:peroxiredoxin
LLVSTGSAQDNRRLIEDVGWSGPLLLQKAHEVGWLYSVPGTPMGHQIDDQGKIVGPLAVGSAALLELVDEQLRQPGAASPAKPGLYTLWPEAAPRRRRGLAVGQEAPLFRLPAIQGEAVSFQGGRGRRLLLLFDEVGCPPCSRLEPRLEQVHHATPELQVTAIRRGDPGSIRASAAARSATFPVLVDQDGEVTRRYGVEAVPPAILISTEGRIAADRAEGGAAIVSLLRSLEESASNTRRLVRAG